MQPNASKVHSNVMMTNKNATQCMQNASVIITNENAINDSQTNLNILDKLCWSNTSQSFSIYTFFQFALVIIVLVTMLNEGKKSFFIYHCHSCLCYEIQDVDDGAKKIIDPSKDCCQITIASSLSSSLLSSFSSSSHFYHRKHHHHHICI